MILQSRIPYDVSTEPRLPGIQPLALADWLMVDDAFAGQMARREDLISTKPEAVVALSESARPAAEELLAYVLTHLGPGYAQSGQHVTRPDGVTVKIDRANPMHTLGRLVQEDLCILEKQGSEQVLTAATLCFPASWMLAEKFMKPLIGIHIPVQSYDENIAARVQRLFDGIQVDRPLWRWNGLKYAVAELHHPRSESDRRPRPVTPEFFRSERQCLVRLPKTRAVVFSIHTFVVKLENAGLKDHD
jgi:hypothetical protein